MSLIRGQIQLASTISLRATWQTKLLERCVYLRVSGNFMTTYNSINKIKQDFQINSEDLDTIRESLNEIRINHHPDKTNGEFENQFLKERYYNANSAIEYIDSLKNNHSLVVVEKMTDLMKIVTELIPNNKQNSLEHNLDTKITSAISTFRSRLFVPKISLTAITAVLTFIFLFPGQIKDNPMLSHYLNPVSTTFALTWLTLLLYSGLFWIMTFLNEEKAKKKLIFLKVDSTQNNLFENFIHYKSKEDTFTKDELAHFVYRSSIENRLGKGYNERHPISTFRLSINRLFGSEMITIEIAQNIAELIIARAEKNNVIAKINKNTLSDTYELKNYR